MGDPWHVLCTAIARIHAPSRGAVSARSGGASWMPTASITLPAPSPPPGPGGVSWALCSAWVWPACSAAPPVRSPRRPPAWARGRASPMPTAAGGRSVTPPASPASRWPFPGVGSAARAVRARWIPTAAMGSSVPPVDAVGCRPRREPGRAFGVAPAAAMASAAREKFARPAFVSRAGDHANQAASARRRGTAAAGRSAAVPTARR